MTRGEAIKDFFYKTILPVAAAALLYCIFRSACVKNGELDYLWLWILCGLPFGIWRLRLWIIPGGGSLGSGIALFALNFIPNVVIHLNISNAIFIYKTIDNFCCMSNNFWITEIKIGRASCRERV